MMVALLSLLFTQLALQDAYVAWEVESATKLASKKDRREMGPDEWSQHLRRMIEFKVDMPASFQELLVQRSVAFKIKAIKAAQSVPNKEVEDLVHMLGLWSQVTSFDPTNPTNSASVRPIRVRLDFLSSTLFDEFLLPLILEGESRFSLVECTGRMHMPQHGPSL